MKKPFSLITITILSGIFLYAGTIKAIDPQVFYESLLPFKLGSDKFLAFGATLLPFIEIFSALALLIPKLRKGALVLILGQFIIFQTWLGQAWARDLIQECPCFGAKGIDIRIEFGINIILMITSVLLLKNEFSPNSTLPKTEQS